MNVLLFNLAMDAQDPALGHVPVWTNELARRCDHVSVITMTVGQFEVEPNVSVHSLGKELGRSEPRRLVEFYRLVNRVLDDRPIDVCFAHMAPLFSVLFAPLAKRRRIPVLLWFSHGKVTSVMRLAHALADRCVTPAASGFPLQSDKLFVVGHGVDTAIFRPPSRPVKGYETTALSIGRISPVKRLDEILESVDILTNRCGVDLRLRLVGGTLTERDREYERALRRACRDLHIEQSVAFEGPVPFARVAERYREGGLFLHRSSSSSLDKSILEAMASGCVPISSNTAFAELARRHGVGWLVPDPGAEGLADAVMRVLGRPPPETAALVARLRRIVQEEHSLGALSDRLLAHLTELRGR